MNFTAFFRDGQSLSRLLFSVPLIIRLLPELPLLSFRLPQNYLDQVSAVDGEISQYGCWVDSGLTYKGVCPLPVILFLLFKTLLMNMVMKLKFVDGGSRIG